MITGQYRAGQGCTEQGLRLSERNPKTAPTGKQCYYRLDRILSITSSVNEGATTVAGILWTIAVILIVLWLLGFALHIAGGLIHILLIIAIIVIVYNFVTSRGRRV